MEDNKILKCISDCEVLEIKVFETLGIKALNGSRLICEAIDVFNHWIDPDFIKLDLIDFNVLTPEMFTRVYETTADGGLMTLFGSLPGDWNQKILTQDQIIEFCDNYRNWLKSASNLTFFLTKKDKDKPIDDKQPYDNLFVIVVQVFSDGLSATFSRLEHDRAWYCSGERRVVVPVINSES